jgi:hypothetical protein
MLTVMPEKMTPQERGHLGGRATTLRKARAARENGRRGGRPRGARAAAAEAAHRRAEALGFQSDAAPSSRSDYCGVKGGRRLDRAPRLDELDEVTP